MKQYVYGLLDDNGDVFYIGKTNNPDERKRQHLRNAKNGIHSKIYSKIRKLIREGYKPEVSILEECDDNNVDEIERQKIAEKKVPKLS